jgi:hydrophobic/amphiphilic exporter-1 (mainly G- bacteria), HAE1 family
MIRFFAAHPTAANLLMIIFIIIGIIAAPKLQRATFPDFTAQEVEIRVPYPGASAEEVEDAICQRIEDAVDGVNDVEEVRCEAREGLGTAVVQLREGGNFDRFMDDIKTEVEAIDSFPEQTELPVIKPLGRTDHVVSLAITGPMSTTDLKAYAEQVKDRLLLVPEVSQVDIEGFSDHQIRIELPAHALRQYGLSVADVAATISRQSINLPAGSIETHAQEVLIRFVDERHTPLAFEDLIVVGNRSGAEIRLGDIARITDRFELDENKILFFGPSPLPSPDGEKTGPVPDGDGPHREESVFNGQQRAAILKISKTKTEDSLIIGDAVKAFVETEQQTAPRGVRFSLTQDSFSIVRDRLQLLLKNGWQGLILVAMTLWLFFSLRFAFWVVMGLPVSFLGTIFFMQLIGQSLNMITMVGLLIAIGLLMDDAIVISENIAAHLRKGKSALQAAIDGTREVAVGVFSSFVTTLCMFGPLAFLQGDIGKVLKVMPVVLILTLLVSLVEAFFILPHHVAHSLAHAQRAKPNRLRQWFESLIEWLRHQVLGRVVDLVVSWRYLFVGLMIAAFIVSAGMLASGKLKFSAFPDIDGDTIEARILLPQGTPLARTEAVVEHITAALNRVNAEFTPRQPNGQSLVKNIQVQFNKNRDAHEVGPHVATITADLLTAEMRVGQLDDIIPRWREEVGDLPDVLSINFKEPSVGPAGLPIEIRMQGSDFNQLKAATLELQQWLNSYKGVFDLSDDLRPGKPEIRLRLREGALALGLDATTIANQLRSAYYGYTASEIQVGPESYEIDVRLDHLDKNSLADLEYFTLTTQDGQQVPLSAVAHLEINRGYARIQRINSQRTVTIQGDVDTRVLNVNELVQDTQTRFLPELQQRYPTITVSFEGATKEGAKTGASIGQGFLLGLIGVFVLLSFQFRSYLEPITVIIAIPLSLIGVIWGHWLMGLDFTMPSLVGYVSLAGIVVNDSILLVEFLKMRVREGLSIHEAASTASRQRFRAVLLTSLTTIAGLVPLLSETSLQAQILIPLVASLVFGLMTSTILVLLLVPALYTILEDFGFTEDVGENA